MQMTEQEARQVMKADGWSYLQRERAGRFYVYAARMRRKAGGREERYICALDSLASLTAEELKRKLA